MSRIALILAAAGTLMLCPRGTVAQDPVDPPDPRFGAVLIWGSAQGGPGPEVEEAMTRAGFDDYSRCVLFCSGVVEHPFSRPLGPSMLVEASYRPWSHIGFALTWSRTEIGTTLGYRGDSDSFIGDHLFVEYGVTTLAPMVVATQMPFSVSVGPALYRAEGWEDDAGGREQVGGTHRFGFLAGVGLSLRLFGAAYLEGRAQYRGVPGGTIGPFTTSGGAVRLPAFDADFSHVFIGFGLGVRL